MIQRIQTVYLLIAAVVLLIAICLPFGYFVSEGLTSIKFTAFGVQGDDVSYSSWGIFCILLLCVIIALATIFIYKNRILQIRMTIFNSILLIGYYLVFLAFLIAFKDALEMQFRINWALCLPLIAAIMNYLAIRAIGRDEVMVKAADRLR